MSAHRTVPAAIVLGLVVLLAAGVWLLSTTPGTLVNDEPARLGPTAQPDAGSVIVIVEEGDSAGEIGRKLEDAGVIESARLFRTLASMMAVVDELAAGEYEFTLGVTALAAVRRISGGITASRTVNIPEGLRLEEIGALLEREGIVSAEEFRLALSEPYTASFLSELPADASLEGFLFPATYNLPLEISAHDMIQRLLAAFDQRYQESILPGLAGRSLLDIVTLASIVEREAQVPEERPTIASVFLNRLELGIALQADPTVQYALGIDPASVEQFGYWKQELTEADLSLDSPYNTYVYTGLPPAPIANPGLDSIMAAVAPANTSLFYFVACPDGSGGHVFAETLEEHIQNVNATDRGECPS